MIIIKEKKPISQKIMEEQVPRMAEEARISGRLVRRDDAWLNEMSIRAISSKKDGLSFRIVTKSPDHTPLHAHIMDIATGKNEQGQFLVTSTPPHKPEDIKDYKQGVTDDMRSQIFQWSKLPYRRAPEISNWKALYLDCLANEKW